MHEVLEEADLQAPDLEDELARAIAAGSPPDELDQPRLASAVAASVLTPMGGSLGSLTLAGLPRAHQLRELDFDLPLEGAARPTGADLARCVDAWLPADDPLAGRTFALGAAAFLPLAGMLTGSIDLTIRVRASDGGPDRYVVADYKTNLLAPWGTVDPEAAAEVFTAWCNDAGGINGRKIEDVERDAKLTEYKQRITESCQEDFMLVGSGGVFDETGQEERLRCMLPEIPGFQVSPEARASELSVSPVPAAIDELQVGLFRYLEDEFPGSTDRVGFLTGNIGSLVFVDAQAQDAAKQLGWTSVYKAQYNSTGEASWTPFAEALSSDKVEGVVYTGEPEGLAKLLQAMADIGYEPKWILAGTNVIDQGFIDVGGAAVKNVYAVASVVPPFLAEDNPATQQYLDLFGEFLPDGKDEALLGYQAFSGWLLFAGAVKQCGSDVTRTCVYDAARKVTDWTGGGLHAEANPSKDQGPECMMVVEATPKGFVIPDDFEPNDGLFSCSKDNIIKLTGDYGSGTTLESVGKSIDDLE